MKKGAKKPTPTDAEMRQTVKAWLKKKHPGADDVQITVWNPIGASEASFQVVGPPKNPKPCGPSDEEYGRMHRQYNHASSIERIARRHFVERWAEMTADLDAYLGELRRVVDLLDQKAPPFVNADIEEGRVREAARHLEALVGLIQRPAIRTKRIIVDIACGIEQYCTPGGE